MRSLHLPICYRILNSILNVTSHPNCTIWSGLISFWRFLFLVASSIGPQFLCGYIATPMHSSSQPMSPIKSSTGKLLQTVTEPELLEVSLNCWRRRRCHVQYCAPMVIQGTQPSDARHHGLRNTRVFVPRKAYSVCKLSFYVWVCSRSDVEVTLLEDRCVWTSIPRPIDALKPRDTYGYKGRHSVEILWMGRGLHQV